MTTVLLLIVIGIVSCASIQFPNLIKIFALMNFRIFLASMVGMVLMACGQNSGQSSGETTSDSLISPIEQQEKLPQSGQTAFESDYHPPVHGPILFSGTFGELRNNHFHSGLDIRTGSVTGWPILAVADGQVVRIRVGPFGFGKALYLAHPNGKTSVYAHLEGFKGEIADYVEYEHYRLKSNEMDVYPAAGKLMVKKGDTIAWSGNTGGSAGPHLHFELRDSRTEHTLDPRLYGFSYVDTIAPKLFKLALYHLLDSAMTRNGRYPAYFFNPSKSTISVPPGEYGLGYYGNDYCTDFANRLGINNVQVMVNDKRTFSLTLDEFSFDYTRYINNHIDFYTYKTTGIRYVKLFEEKRNPLNFYQSVNRGKINLKEGDSLNIEVILTDRAGLSKSAEFTMIATTNQTFPASSQKSFGAPTYLTYPDKTNYKVFEAFKWTIPASVLYHPQELAYVQKPYSGNKYLSDIHQFHYDLIAMHQYSTISIKPKNIEGLPKEKLCIVNLTAGGYYEGGSYSNGWVNTKTRSFGQYAVSIDTIAPRLKFLGKRNQTLRFGVSDNLSGLKRWEAWIDGQWTLLEYEPKNGTLTAYPQKKPDGQKHSIKVLVTDNKFNKTEFIQTIFY